MDVLNELTQMVERTPKSRTQIMIDRTLADRLMGTLARNVEQAKFLFEAEHVLGYKEFRLLRALYQANGEMVTNDSLQYCADIDNLDTLWVHIRRLRIKLAQYSMGSINTVRELRHSGYVYVKPEQAQ